MFLQKIHQEEYDWYEIAKNKYTTGTRVDLFNTIEPIYDTKDILLAAQYSYGFLIVCFPSTHELNVQLFPPEEYEKPGFLKWLDRNYR